MNEISLIVSWSCIGFLMALIQCWNKKLFLGIIISAVVVLFLSAVLLPEQTAHSFLKYEWWGYLVAFVSEGFSYFFGIKAYEYTFWRK